MNRRLLHHLVFISSTVAALGMAWASRKPSMDGDGFIPPPVENPRQVGLRSVLETAVRDAFAGGASTRPASLPKHLQDQWAHWQRFGSPKLSSGTPWTRFDAFDSLARYTWVRLWDPIRSALMVDVHRFDEADDSKLQRNSTNKSPDSGWLTAVFESRNEANLHLRILNMAVELQLAWLLENRDRYPHNPAARHAQVETEDWEISSRVARALTYAVYDAVADQERRLRANPGLAGTNVPMRTVLTALGPAPTTGLPPRKLGGAVRDPQQPVG